jgi:hypothetical protein
MNRTIEEVQAEQAKIRRAYFHVFASEDAKLVMKDLENKFGGSTLRQIDKKIDVHASIAAAGCREVLLYIQAMMRKPDATT